MADACLPAVGRAAAFDSPVFLKVLVFRKEPVAPAEAAAVSMDPYLGWDMAERVLVDAGVADMPNRGRPAETIQRAASPAHQPKARQ
jgi:hypothetical protein